MTRRRIQTQTNPLSRPIGLLSLGLFLSACGGGGNGTIGSGNQFPQAGPSAIVNGTSLAFAKSHWKSTNCSVQVELSSDYGFYSVVVAKTGTTTSITGHWATGPDANSLTTDISSGLAGSLWVSTLKTITGSTVSQTFTANVTVQPNTQALGNCIFVLVQGPLS